MPRKNILLAMFDIRPTGGTEGFSFGEIEPEVNLRAKVAISDTSRLRLENSNLENSRGLISKEKNDISRSDLGNPKGPTLVKSSPIFRHRKSQGLAMSEPADSRFPARSANFVPKVEIDEDLFRKLPKPSSKGYILEEFERVMSEPASQLAELVNFGGYVHNTVPSKPRSKFIKQKKAVSTRNPEDEELKIFWANNYVEKNKGITNEIEEKTVRFPATEKIKLAAFGSHEERAILAESEDNGYPHHSPASREIEMWLDNLRRSGQDEKPSLEKGITPPGNPEKKRSFFKSGAKWSSWFRRNRYHVVIGLVIGGLAFNFIYHNGIGAGKNIVQNGNNAVTNLEEAKKDLEEFKFLEAADRFALAYDDFNRASGTLSQLGDSFVSIFGNIPGLSKIKVANSLIEAGQSISKAGENLALAFGTLYKTNLLSFLDGANNSQNSKSISKILGEFRDVLVFAEKNITRADNLLANIDLSVLPEDKQQLFVDFKEKIPDFQEYIGDAVDYSEFLLNVIGEGEAKIYLVLLQNNSELRPTGGFPGTYAVVTFENGSLKKIFVDDVYRLDASLKENIIPPKPLQHITPNWGLRDAAWWADFPASARKIEEFYKLNTGEEIDGVLTVTPTVIGRIFDIIGPIEMSEYGVTLNSDNFLHIIQNEVEYEADRASPKQIVVDLQPLFFERLSRQDKDKWVEIFKVLLESAEQKHILAYLNDKKLREIAVKNGVAGELKQPEGDYLQVVFANIKGSKTDFVTSNAFNLETQLGDSGSAGHTLKISRFHGGGNSEYGFYNRDNSAYVKAYVPLGSRFQGIKGNNLTDYRPLIGHEDFGFKEDPDLVKIDDSISHPFPDVDVFEESGKTVFGFWMITRPGETKTVTIEYSVPKALTGSGYHLIWQKQSGTRGDQINFSFKIPEGNHPVNYTADLQLIGDSLMLNSDLTIDRDIDIEIN